ncbi:hypothetical protein [uncultured Deinococcus sp.]|uniref:hypothetical protein n=1 Tax=uncultured Deinococcus sp. TaxID=158789 RepID=UPI0025EC5FA3|nr:hypothetical protein [uncultured Deinococcus sp.]
MTALDRPVRSAPRFADLLSLPRPAALSRAVTGTDPLVRPAATWPALRPPEGLRPLAILLP